jgi:hypothetical protein
MRSTTGPGVVVESNNNREAEMKASVGDRVVIAASRVDGPVRDGEILAVGPDGGPPYRIRWSDQGREGLFFPGADAHIQHFAGSEGHHPPVERDDDSSPATNVSASPGTPVHSKTWRVDIVAYEGQHATSAQAVLHGEVRDGMTGIGVARRRPGDVDLPLVGDEVALGRALRRRSDVLLKAAAEELSETTGSPVELTA